MGTLAHFKNLYTEAFENCKPEIVVVLLKIYSVFSAIMIFMAIYAFMDRLLNGFEFWFENQTLFYVDIKFKWKSITRSSWDGRVCLLAKKPVLKELTTHRSLDYAQGIHGFW